MSPFNSAFNLLLFLPVVLYLLGAASVIKITISLIQSARALERIE